MNKKVKVSIVIPNYNGDKYFTSISKVIEPYYNDGIEIILVDDGSKSTDNTCDLFREHWPNVKIIKQKNNGVASARNSGARIASSEYLQFLDIDDSTSMDKLSKQYFYAKENNFDVVYSDWQMAILENDKLSFENIVISKNQKNMAFSLINGWWQPPHSYLIKKTAYDLIGGSDESLVNAQDFDLVVRLALNRFSFGYLPGNFSTYFRYVDHISLARGSRQVYWESYDRCLKKCYAIAEENNVLDDNLKRAFANKWFHVARNTYQLNTEWALSIVDNVKSFYPKFKAEKESKLFSKAYNLFGYSTAELFVKTKQSILK